MIRAAYLTTMLHVADVRRSIDFYRLLGLELTDLEGELTCPVWARMHSEGGDLMLLLETPMQGVQRPFSLYLYTDELVALREHLLAGGIEVSEISRPDYMKSGEISMAIRTAMAFSLSSGVRLNTSIGNVPVESVERNCDKVPQTPALRSMSDIEIFSPTTRVLLGKGKGSREGV